MGKLRFLAIILLFVACCCYGSESFVDVIDTLEEFTAEELDSEQYISNVDRAISLCRGKEEFEKLAFTVFSGDRGKSYASGLMQTPATHRILLLFMLFDSSSLLEDIRTVFKNAFEEWKGLETVEKYCKKSSSSGPWNADIDPETEVGITWGGANFSFFLEEFLNGKSDGYLFEDNTHGIWVTPYYNQEIEDFSENFEAHLKSSYRFVEEQLERVWHGNNANINPSLREVEYAVRTPIIHFDRPVILSATIKAKHLVVASKQNRAYEAGLPKEALEHLKDIKKHTMFERDKVGYFPVAHALIKNHGIPFGQWPRKEQIEDVYKHDQELCERLVKYARRSMGEPLDPIKFYFYN